VWIQEGCQLSAISHQPSGKSESEVLPFRLAGKTANHNAGFPDG